MKGVAEDRGEASCSGRKAIVLVISGILLLAFTVRLFGGLGYWNWFDRKFPDTWENSKIILSQDGTQYIQQANPGTWISDSYARWDSSPYYRPPLASYYFQGLFRLCGFSRLVVLSVQSAIAIVAYLLLYLTITRIFSRRIGVISLVVLSIHPVLIFYDHSFEDSSLALFLMSVGLYLFVRAFDSKSLVLVLSGFFIGMGTLARGNLVIMFVCLAIFVLFLYKGNRVTALLKFTVPAILVMIFPAWHNYRASGRFSFITNTAGENLFWGNNEDPRLRITLQGFTTIPQIDAGCPGMFMMKRLMVDFEAETTDQAFRAAALDYMRRKPGQAAMGFLKKLGRHFSNYEIPRNRNFSRLRNSSVFFRLPLIPYSVLAGFVLFGIYGMKKRWSRLMIFLFPWFCALASEVIFFNASRYRSLAIPFLMPIAVLGAATIWEFIRQRQRKKVLVAVLIFAAFFLLGSFVVAEKEKKQFLSASLLNDAMLEAYGEGESKRLAFYDEQHFLESLEKSLEYDPNNLEAFHVYQKYLILKGQTNKAVENIRAHRVKCGDDDWLCMLVCDYLVRLATHLQK